VSSDALLIDFGGVLTTSVFDAFGAFCVEHGMERDAAATCFRHDPESSALLVALEKGEMDDATFEAGMSERLRVATGVTVAPDGLLTAMTAALQPVPELIDATRRIRARGVPTIMVSNAMGTHSYDLIDVDELFDHAVLSTTLGVRKPSRKMYSTAAELAGVAPERCLMVDDLEQNLSGAARIGMPGHLHVTVPETLARLEQEFGSF
jgi:putative hydrolase of the HAD superfamily